MRSIDRAFYKSAAWLKCRDGYIKSVGGLCERCLAENKIVPGYIVHHKIHLNADNFNDPSIALNYDNLEYLCLYHHNLEHGITGKKKRYKIDDDGNVLIFDDA